MKAQIETVTYPDKSQALRLNMSIYPPEIEQNAPAIGGELRTQIGGLYTRRRWYFPLTARAELESLLLKLNLI